MIRAALRHPVLPPAPALPRSWDTALAVGLAGLGVVLLYSTAGVNLFLAALLLFGLSVGPVIWRLQPWREPTLAAGLVLLLYIGLHTLWTAGGGPDARSTVNRYHELAMAPVLYGLFRLVSRKDAFFRGLAVGALGYAAAHWLAPLHPPLVAELAARRISAGFALAVCAFLFLDHARHSPHPWPWRLGAAFLAATVLFAIDGRTGHLVLLVLAAFAAWHHSRGRRRWTAVVAVPVLVVAVALASPAVRTRMAEGLSALEGGGGSAVTSSSLRMHLVRSGLLLAQEHYATGAGYTRVAEVHSAIAQRQLGGPAAQDPGAQAHLRRVANLHNEYLMQLVGGGVAALVLFVAWLGLPLVRAGPAQPALAGLALAFAAGCLFNSLLMDFTEGHFHMVLLAWLLARGPEA